MNATAALLVAFTLVVAVVDWIAVGTGKRTAEYVFKPLTMVVLIAAAVAIDPVNDTMKVLFIGALVFSLFGDVFLMVPRNLFVLCSIKTSFALKLKCKETASALTDVLAI